MNKYLSKLQKIPFAGTIGRPAAAGTAIGAIGGAGVGAYRADEGSRLSGALKGGAVGGLVGAGVGAASSYPNVKKLLDARTARRAERVEHYAMIDDSIARIRSKHFDNALYDSAVEHKLPRNLHPKVFGDRPKQYAAPLPDFPSQVFSDRGLVRLRGRMKALGVHLDPKNRGSYLISASEQLSNAERPYADALVRRVMAQHGIS